MALLLEPNQVYSERVVKRENNRAGSPGTLTGWVCFRPIVEKQDSYFPSLELFTIFVASLAADGLHSNLDTVSILILWKCSTEKSSAWTKTTWQLISREFYFPYLVGTPNHRRVPECAEGGLWPEIWLSQEGGLGELDLVWGEKVAFSARLTAGYQLNLYLEMSAFVTSGKHSHFGVIKWQHIQVLWRTKKLSVICILIKI